MISSTFKVLRGHKNLLNFEGFLKVNLLAAVFDHAIILKFQDQNVSHDDSKSSDIQF